MERDRICCFDTDVDLLTRQAFWVCFAVASIMLGFAALTDQLIAASFDAVFYLLGGVGSRQRSRIAATVMFIVYTFSTLLLPGFGMLSIGRFICIGLMLGNLRAIWLSAKWPPPLPPPEDEMHVPQTFMDKLVDRWPPAIWRTMSWLFYVLAAIESTGIIILLARRFFLKPPA